MCGAGWWWTKSRSSPKELPLWSTGMLIAQFGPLLLASERSLVTAMHIHPSNSISVDGPTSQLVSQALQRLISRFAGAALQKLVGWLINRFAGIVCRKWQADT